MGAAPFEFVCPVARRNREGLWSSGNVPPYPKGHDRIVRTGRTKPRPVDGKRSGRNLPDRHEYRCQCGHVGWSAHAGILRYPANDDQDVPGYVRPFHTHQYLTERGDEGHAHPDGGHPHHHVTDGRGGRS